MRHIAGAVVVVLAGRRRSTSINTEDPMGHAERDSRKYRHSAPEPAPRIGRKDRQDPGRDTPEPERPAPDGEPEHGEPDADGRPVQLEIPATEQRDPGE